MANIHGIAMTPGHYPAIWRKFNPWYMTPKNLTPPGATARGKAKDTLLSCNLSISYIQCVSAFWRAMAELRSARLWPDIGKNFLASTSLFGTIPVKVVPPSKMQGYP
jgi:hypothetical protein